MGDDTATAGKLLKQAIRSEINGRRFYEFLAGKTSQPDAKRKLTSLADDERRHELALRKIYKKQYGEEADDIPEQGIGALAEFFADPEGKRDKSEIQYIEMAIEAELAATNFYKDGAKNASDEDIKAIYRKMADEEYSHYESLQAEKSAIGGNYYWFGFDEASPLEH